MATVGKGVPGYVTPKVAVGAAVGNDKGELLLIQRADSGIWLYPTGWCDVGYSAAEVVVKEVEEETGIEVEPIRLIAVLDGLRLGFTRVPLYSLLFYCRAVGGSLTPASPGVSRRRLVHPGHHALADRRIGALERHRLRRAGRRTPRRPLRQCPPTHVAGRFADDLMVADLGLTIAVAETADAELHAAVAHLVPQLSRSSGAPVARTAARGSLRTPPRHCCSLARRTGDAAGAPGRGQVVGMLTLVVFTLPTGVRAWIEDVVVDDDVAGWRRGQHLDRGRNRPRRRRRVRARST